MRGGDSFAAKLQTISYLHSWGVASAGDSLADFIRSTKQTAITFLTIIYISDSIYIIIHYSS
jgi:hypothetical protein